MQLPEIDVIFSCSEDNFLPAVDVWIVIDVLRATTMITRWFELGGTELYPVRNPDEARKLISDLRERGSDPLLMGEVNGIPPEGFDLGNSPADLNYKVVQEHYCGVISTTNGTVALLEAASSGSPVIASSLRNASAVIDHALTLGNNIGVLCSGRKGRPCLEDTLCAGALVDDLNFRYANKILMSDSAKIALTVWNDRGENLEEYIRKSDHAKFLEHIGFSEDIKFCSEYDACTVVPMLFNDKNEHTILRSVIGSSKPHAERIKPLEQNKISKPELEPVKKINDPFEELLQYTRKPSKYFYIHNHNNHNHNNNKSKEHK